MTSAPEFRDQPSSDDIKAVLRHVFESQIPNYGDYNLVCAVPGGDGAETYYVVGYRWRPAELVFAPFDPETLAGTEAPTAVNSTNLSHTDEVNSGDYEVGTNTGRLFRFRVLSTALLPKNGDGGERRIIEQAGDLEDFSAFLDHFVTLA
ncbi:hypothetical protein [Arthrobacter sp. 08Y14]|uniref:hypothetical protein n=1 Tax=Arthrobacter sp. 08Y14 TaxID=2058885 RepID=UPI000CE338A0|nr:hypothetical protein [Arthrobacter sp. 08Y14]